MILSPFDFSLLAVDRTVRSVGKTFRGYHVRLNGIIRKVRATGQRDWTSSRLKFSSRDLSGSGLTRLICHSIEHAVSGRQYWGSDNPPADNRILSTSNQRTMGVDSTWVVLDPKSWLDDPDKWEKKLLGAVVRDFYTPTNRKPNDLSEYHENDVTITTHDINDFILSSDASGGTSIEGKLTALLRARVVNTSAAMVDLSAKTVKLRRIDQDEDYWEKLREDPSVQKYLPIWIRRARRGGFPSVCLVVGIAICENVESEWDKTRVAEHKANMEVPLDFVISVAVGSPSRSPQARKSIFALQLRVIEKEGWIGWFGWFGSQTVMGRGPAVEPGHELGEEDEDEEGFEIADLVLHELKDVPVIEADGATEGTEGVTEEK
ncbi:hypothetical protein B0T17DRAFT_502374 [Bombardia bombarda]|uniref:Uncharacterized protein n=1 Tax=Bombardia bombarda TaxID=252184 RepID=A0AA39XIQ1_9PEZI|nr:hypothetical protein B0T17DRAFT_502374 [Bombardia bombarda]